MHISLQVRRKLLCKIVAAHVVRTTSVTNRDTNTRIHTNVARNRNEAWIVGLILVFSPQNTRPSSYDTWNMCHMGESMCATTPAIPYMDGEFAYMQIYNHFRSHSVIVSRI